ncbi:MAG: hypothetical protein WBL91_20545, partial [Pseudolabrys sp.]
MLELMVPRGGIAQANIINTLGWLTSLTARIEPKGISGALANPQRDPTGDKPPVAESIQSTPAA